MLHEFIQTHRQELIARTRRKVLERPAPGPTEEELAHGVPLFLDQLVTILRLECRSSSEDEQPSVSSAGEAASVRQQENATEHGADWLAKGFTIAQVVHDYGDICQAVTELAVERQEQITSPEFRTLNRCLDEAIASAVSEYGRLRANRVTEDRGFFAHELRNKLNAAFLSFRSIQSGRVGVRGSTMSVLHRSLLGMRALVDRSLSEVRLNSGLQHQERLRVAELVEEVEIAAQLDAGERGMRLDVEPVPYGLFVHADRQLLASALSNLLQNAFKFSREAGRVWLRTRASGERVMIEIEDQCGGLPAGKADALFQPFEQAAADRSGLGLGLAISRQAIEANGGALSVTDVPGKGCIFKIDLPMVQL